MDIEYALQKIGLSKQEALVYLSSLKLGVAKASEIAQKSGIKREASYYILKSLHEKGFISEVIRSGVKYYSAVHPKRILEILDEEKRQKKEAIEGVLPEIDSLIKTALTRPKIEFYEGVEGFKTVVSKLVQKPAQEIYCYIPESPCILCPHFIHNLGEGEKKRRLNLKLSQNLLSLWEIFKKLISKN